MNKLETFTNPGSDNMNTTQSFFTAPHSELVRTCFLFEPGSAPYELAQSQEEIEDRILELEDEACTIEAMEEEVSQTEDENRILEDRILELEDEIWELENKEVAHATSQPAGIGL